MNLDLLKIDNILKYVIAFCVGTFYYCIFIKNTKFINRC